MSAPGRRAGEADEGVERARLGHLAHRRRRGATACPLRRPGGSSPGRLEERLAKSQVGVHRARPHRPGRGLGDETARRASASPAGRARRAHLGRPPSGATPPNEPGLLDGLRGADVVELGRAVRRADDHRHPGQVRLHDRRVHLERRRAARGEQDRRAARGEADPEGEERRRALVQADVQGDAALAGESDRERSRARAGGDDGVGEPGAHPLVDERGRRS